ncbi:MAG: hypothetical protein V1708_02160, partial [Candidatus Micrarchaeota archaeon]
MQMRQTRFFRLLLLALVGVFALPVWSASTCAQLGVPNCHEIVPGQSGSFYTYLPQYDTYKLDNTDSANHYFLLMGDLSCDRSCIVPRFASPKWTQYMTTIDLNGYTISYSDANYGTMANTGFESWTGNTPDGWTVVSGSVERRNASYYHPMTGN